MTLASSFGYIIYLDSIIQSIGLFSFCRPFKLFYNFLSLNLFRVEIGCEGGFLSQPDCFGK
jgi:hypothetical protein